MLAPFVCPLLFGALFAIDLEGNMPLILGGAAAGLLVLVLLGFLLFRSKPTRNPESGLAEDLSAYPPPPKQLGSHQVGVMTQPGRLRLVVVAPVGKKALPEPEAVLEQIMPGLGEVAQDDKARLRTWPPQLSTPGFAPTFFRLTQRPGPEGKPSRWVLLAGPARAGDMKVLLGLAVFLDQPSKLGAVTLGELQWAEVLQVEAL